VLRALHLNAGNLYGGVETMLVTLAREAHRAPGMSPSFGACFDGRYSRELEALGHAVHPLGAVRLSRPDTVLRARRALTAYLQRGAADVVVCHQAWTYAVFGPAVRRASLPIALWLHTVSARRHWLERWAERRSPSVVVANSRYTAAAASNAFAGVPVECIYCPLSLATATPTTGVEAAAAGDAGGPTTAVEGATGAVRASVRAACDTPLEDVVIVQVGRLETLKGHRVALEACALLRDVPGWTYWVVGGPQRPSDERVLGELMAQARRSGVESRVRFLGERDDVSRVLRAADLYCQPNVGAESFGLSLVEAMAAGLPVVASALGGAREIVDASCGVLTAAGDARSVARALRSLIIDPAARARLGAGARKRPDALCNPARQMRQIEEALARVASMPFAATGS
jgi:glycosyltransferase involved in cell wall biosynthesis